MPEYLVAHEQPNDNDPSVETETMATVKASERRRKDNSRMSTPRKAMKTTIWIMAPVLAISIGFLVPNAAAQPDPYPKMAPVDQYLMEENTEIQLARSAAPDSISRDATILVLRRQGYETTRLRSKARTALSAWWDEAGQECLTGRNSGARR
jgi:hypothetical protein